MNIILRNLFKILNRKGRYINGFTETIIELCPKLWPEKELTNSEQKTINWNYSNAGKR